MNFRERVALWLRPGVYLGHNPLTLLGAVLTTGSATTLVWFWLFELATGREFHPYTGIIIFLLLPGVFVVGLLLIPLGLWLRRQKLRGAGQLPDVYPQIDLRQPGLRRGVTLVMILTFVNVVILGTASYRGVEHMESVQFCGQSCHSVMEPEFTAYQDSPHSRVACVQCHIGPGASWFVKSKLSGARQVLAVTFKTYSRPIPSPVRELRPARETCEQCHWPQKFHGDKILVRTKYSDDEKNTPLTTVLVLKIGGRSGQSWTGIHGRHLYPFEERTERISYIATDDRRQVIPVVKYIDDSGQTVEFSSAEVKPTPDQLANGERRQMDCMDCHNRPTHAFQMPTRAVDKALEEGRISKELPFIKKKAVEVLLVEYPDRATASERIASVLTAFYRDTYPDVYRAHRARVEAAVNQVQRIYLRNVFPRMRIKWGTYPNNIGHADFLGCFRCHDGSHQSKDGRTITQECDACHTLLAMEEENPKILANLGLK